MSATLLTENTIAGEDLQLLNIEQVADLCDVHTSTVRRLVDNGEIVPPLRMGRALRWRLVEIREWMARGCPRLRPVQPIQGEMA
jgi:excisionase family DNA binding protein